MCEKGQQKIPDLVGRREGVQQLNDQKYPTHNIGNIKTALYINSGSLLATGLKHDTDIHIRSDVHTSCCCFKEMRVHVILLKAAAYWSFRDILAAVRLTSQ
jgi:hypothetical protein